MPGVFLHTVLAERVIEGLHAAGLAPFDPSDPRCRAALVHGALGPDLGYFPGGDALVSEVAHRLRTGRMARALIGAAANDAEVAFACGWISHLLADARLHPIVDTEAGMLLRRCDDEAAPWNGSASPISIAHVRVEVGLDAAVLARYPNAGRRLPVAFDEQSLAFLEGAFRRTYGGFPQGSELHAAHTAVTRWHRCLVPLVRWMTADWSPGSGVGGSVAPLIRAGDGSWVRYLGAGPVAAAFVSPARPDDRLVERIEREVEDLASLCVEAIRDPSGLTDVDMEDGRTIHEGGLKPAAAHTLAALERRIRERRWPAYSVTLRKPMTKATAMSAINSTP